MTEFNKNAIALLNGITASRIATKMRDVRNGRRKYERSWVWELIQNAKDKAAIDFPNEKVSILVKFSNSELEFAHNFGFFTRQNVEGLIRQINTDDKDREDVDKTEQPKTTGRFGTGFMTTHLLSEKVRVKGIYQNEDNTYSTIQFPLDRSGKEKSELIESVDASFESAEISLRVSRKLHSVSFSDFNTTFFYNLDEQGNTIAQTGVDDLTLSLPYTLIFIDRIKDVKIINGTKKVVYTKREPHEIQENIWLVQVDKITNDNIEKNYFLFLSKNLTRIAIQVESENGTFKILPLKENTPRIFLDFPLIGTETFYFPVVINNPFFEPNEPRNGIFLDEIGTESVTDQSFFKEAVELFGTLLNFATDTKCVDLYNLAKTKLPEKRDNFSQDWFKTNVQKPIRTHLLKSEIVQTETNRILLENALFPYAVENKIEKFWCLAKFLHKDKMPKSEHIHEWHKIIDSTWDKDLRYDLKKMVVEIATYKNIETLMLRVGLGEQETLSWLNGVIEFIVCENEKLLSDYAIIPNQYGNFKTKENLWADESVPKELKDVLKILQEDWRSSLQHQSISAYQPAAKKGIDDIVNRINTIIRADSVPNIKTAVLDLLSLFPNSNELPKDRNEFFSFAKDFYPNTPDKRELENWIKSDSAWEECDKWFMKNLIYDISQYQNTSRLTTFLNSNSLTWLHKFINFVSAQRFEAYLDNYAILPNQKGDFRKKKDLFVDEDYNPLKPKLLNDLKDILEFLNYDCRAELLATEIAINIEGKSQTAKDIANKITERVQHLLRDEGLKHRHESTKQVFSKLLLWFHENESQAKEYFTDLYEKRHRLRSDDEIIADIKFRQSLLSNPNGYTEEEILNLINTPKDKLHIFSDEEIEQEIQKQLKEQINDQDKIEKELFDPSKLAISLGITNAEDLENARIKFAANERIIDALQHFSRSSDFSYVHRIIERAKINVKTFLSTQSNYNIENWNEESFTVISGVLKDGKMIKIVIRPADGGHIIVWYSNEYNTLEQTNMFAELWYDTGSEQAIYSFGRFLKRTGISRIPI